MTSPPRGKASTNWKVSSSDRTLLMSFKFTAKVAYLGPPVPVVPITGSAEEDMVSKADDEIL